MNQEVKKELEAVKVILNVEHESGASSMEYLLNEVSRLKRSMNRLVEAVEKLNEKSLTLSDIE